MRQLTNTEIERIKLLTEKSVELTLIEPTATGLEKSIMDATGPVRNYLKSKSVHDYTDQKQGPDYKIQYESRLIYSDKLSNSIVSLYRPSTKKGDSRIWFTGLKTYSQSNDIIGIIAYDGMIYVLNITRLNVRDLLDSEINNPLKELVNEINQVSNQISDELLIKLRKISANGFVPALLQADTAIGRTLESLLDIPMNSFRTPDYKGIELKSFRENRGTRKGLFGKTPNWDLSRFKSRVEILDNFGYWRDGIFRIANTIRATGRNTQGLILRTDYDWDYLIENSDRENISDFLIWELSVLRETLATKHKETFWITTESKQINGTEHFLYKSVEHTKNPLVNQLGVLIDNGVITVDYCIKRLENGKVEDEGCNFKMRSNALSLLFPPSQKCSLI